MYVLVLVEHGVKLRIARQRAAARRGVRRCRHFWMSAPRNSARQAARRTPRRRTPPAPSEKQERLWTWHSFTISFVGFEKEGGKAVAAVFSAAQWDKNVKFTSKRSDIIMKQCHSNLEDCRFKPRMLQGSIHEWHWHWNLWHGLSMSVFSVYQQQLSQGQMANFPAFITSKFFWPMKPSFTSN